MSAASAPSPIFNAQERVLCYHGPLIYEAKVLKTKTFETPSPTTGVAGPHYLVHYKGWKQTYVSLFPFMCSSFSIRSSLFFCYCYAERIVLGQLVLSQTSSRPRTLCKLQRLTYHVSRAARLSGFPTHPLPSHKVQTKLTFPHL